MPIDLLSADGRSFLEREYVIGKRSTYDIARELGTNPNRVRRALRHHGLPVRSQGDAQRQALASGRGRHPTEGKRRPPQTRVAISDGVAQAWRVLTSTERGQRVESAKRQWEAMDDRQREALRAGAAEGVRRAAAEGSKLEKFLVTELLARGVAVEFHRQGLVSSEAMHVDLWLPKLQVAIEVDGPAHFLPIWGEANLAKHVRNDQRKTGLLLRAGYRVVRVKVVAGNVSEFQQRRLLAEVLSTLETEEQFTQLEVA